MRADVHATENRVTLGCFEVGGRAYGLDVSCIREIVRWRPVTPLPRSPTLIEGVIDLRGAVIPVVDLGRALGVGCVAGGPNARIVIAELEELLVGLTVDAALEVLPVDVAQLSNPPLLASQAGNGATRALVRRPNDDPILVLSLDHLIENVYRSARPEPEATQ